MHIIKILIAQRERGRGKSWKNSHVTADSVSFGGDMLKRIVPLFSYFSGAFINENLAF